jgi:hypothetical protein
MTRGRFLGALLTLALAGCAAAEGSPSASQSLTPSPSPSAPRATPTATATPTSEPTAASAMKRCENENAGYVVTYPADWYVGSQSDGFYGCDAFGRSPISDQDDPAIDISLIAQPDMGWNDPFQPMTGEAQGYRLLVDEETTLFGQRAWNREWVITEASAGLAKGDLLTRYELEYRKGWFVVAAAFSKAALHDETTAVLLRMLETLETPSEP